MGERFFRKEEDRYPTKKNKKRETNYKWFINKKPTFCREVINVRGLIGL